MASFGTYSLKAGIILALFWIIYRLFLQKETFYRFNRGFLLTGLIAALTLPLIIIHYTVEVNTPTIPIHLLNISDIIQAASEASTPFDATILKLCFQLSAVVYLTVLAVLLIIRSLGFVRLFKTIRQKNFKRYAGYHLIESSEFDGAFSFFRFVFLPQNLKEAEKHIILKHEYAHIEQKHWMDLFLSNTLSLIWWFNPVIWLYGIAIRNNHEYLADQEVLTGYQPDDYHQTLLNQWFKTPVFPMTNLFAYTNYLKRIKMMKKKNSNPLKQLFALLAIPAIALFLMAFSEKEYVMQESQKSQQDSVITQEATIVIRGNQQIGKESPLILVDGKEVPSSNDINPREIESMSILKGESATDIYGTTGKNGAILITTKKGEAIPKEPFALKANDSTLLIVNDKAVIRIEHLQNSSTIKPLYLIDGIEVSPIDDFNSEDIKSIEVLKDKSATDIYGEKGKNGVILITTKKRRMMD